MTPVRVVRKKYKNWREMSYLLLEDLHPEIERSYKKLEEIRFLFDVDAKEMEIQRLEQEMMAPGFWDDPDKAQSVTAGNPAERHGGGAS